MPCPRSLDRLAPRQTATTALPGPPWDRPDGPFKSPKPQRDLHGAALKPGGLCASAPESDRRQAARPGTLTGSRPGRRIRARGTCTE